MRYKVQIAGSEREVEVVDTAHGYQVRVGDGPVQEARLVASPAPLYVLELGEQRHTVALEADADEAGRFQVALPGRTSLAVTTADARFANVLKRGNGATARLKKLKSPMPGVILELHVEPGQEVTKGQVLLILEAMKMQNEIRAEGDGKVKSLGVGVGDTVGAGALLIDFD